MTMELSKEFGGKRLEAGREAMDTSQSDLQGEVARKKHKLEECVCNRKPTLIKCLSCGHIFTGRIATVCPAHENRMCLMDHIFCTNKSCQSSNLEPAKVLNDDLTQ